jgi:predicted heme/steroid binding protein
MQKSIVISFLFVLLILGGLTACASPEPQTFTLEELAQYDGQNGNKAYIAVDGKVYDVSRIGEWAGGVHNGITAGTDASDFINQAPHGTSVLKNLRVVGTLIIDEDPDDDTDDELKVFTLTELAQFNGQNGAKAYIAVDGKVYDVTAIGAWTGGTHNGIVAGTDASSFIAQAPHGRSVLEDLPVVGELSD